MIPDLIDYEGLAKIVHLKVPTLRKMVSQRRIPYIKVGNRVFFDSLEIEKWLDDRRIPMVGRK